MTDTLEWTEDKLAGQGAIDLTGLTMGDDANPVTFTDVQALTHDDWEAEQLDYSEAMRKFKNLLGIKPLHKQREFVEGLSTEKAREESNQERATKLEQARLHSYLFNVHKVKYIAWVPEVLHSKKPVKNRDGTLAGKYSCKFEVQT